MQLSLNFGETPPAIADLRQRLLAAFGPFRSDVRHETAGPAGQVDDLLAHP